MDNKKRAKELAQKTAQVAKAVAKTTTKIAVRIAQAAVQAAEKLVSALVAIGGWAVLVVVLIVVIIIASLAASPFGIFISEEVTQVGAIPLSQIIAECNVELTQEVENIELSIPHEDVEVVDNQANWNEIIAVFAAKTAGAEDGTAEDVVVFNAQKAEKLKEVFRNANTVSYTTSPYTDAEGNSKTKLTITVTGKTKDELIKTIGKAAARILINFYSGKMSANNTDLDNISYSPHRLVLSKVADDGTEYIMKQTKLEIAATAVAPLAYTAFWAYEKNAKVPTEKISDVEKVVTKIGKEVGATKMADKINTYLEKTANYIVNKLNHHQLTRAISPIILCNGENGQIFRMTDDTTLEGAGTLEIMMTSPTEELLAPAYEKYIAVVDTENGKVRQQATVPGSTQYWTLDFPKAGTYKVVLSCVDYYGNIINKTHTVTVK